MDPATTLIVTALVNGILAGVQRSAADATYQGYRALRAAILRRYGSLAGPRLEQAMDELEVEPTAGPRQEAVAHELERVGAGDDPYLRQLADELTALIEDPLRRSGNGAVRVERVHRRAGVRAIGKVMDRHVHTVLRARATHRLDDTDLLSDSQPAKRLPQEVRDEVQRLHVDMREIIEQIAQRIEQGNYADTEEAIRAMPLSFDERERAVNLVDADKRMHVSYQTLRITVEYFSELNEMVLAKIDREQSPDREATMMLGNAIMIYELTEFVIRYIEGFRVDGTDEIERLHHETGQKIRGLREEQRSLERRVSAEGIEAAVRDHTLEDIRNRESAINELEREWAKYLGEVAALRSMIGEVQHKVPTLEIIRDNARVQIGVLQLVAMLRFLKQNADAIKGTIDSLKGFRLAPLSSSRVRRLIGM